MKALVALCGAIAGLMMMIVGGLIPAAILSPSLDYPSKLINLPSTWQVPSLLICSIVCGPRAGVMASTAYLAIGLFQLPVFHDGGNIEYLQNAGFGYLAGFIPASWVTGRYSRKKGWNKLPYMTISALYGLGVIHIIGIINLSIGTLLSRWPETFLDLLISYSLAPLPSQIALCAAVAIISSIMRVIILVE